MAVVAVAVAVAVAAVVVVAVIVIAVVVVVVVRARYFEQRRRLSLRLMTTTINASCKKMSIGEIGEASDIRVMVRHRPEIDRAKGNCKTRSRKPTDGEDVK